MKKLASILSLFLILGLARDVLAQEPSATYITVEGQLVRAVGSGAFEAGIPVMLHSYANQQMVDAVEDVTGPGGAFRFDSVEAAEGRVFEVMATVGRTAYFSQSAAPSPGQTRLELPVTVYETTVDASAIRVEQMHAIIEFLSPAQMRIMEVYIISNDGDRAVEGAVTLDDGQTAALRFTLPTGATGVSFEGGKAGDGFVLTPDGFASTLGVPPGSQALQFTVGYVLPYQEGMRVERMLSYPTEAMNVILLQPGVSLTSDALTRQGSRQMPDGRQVELFAAQALEPGQSLAFELSGQPQVSAAGASQAPSAPVATSPALVPIGLAVLGLALLGGGVAWWRRGMAGPGPAASSASTLTADHPSVEENLIRAIAELDESYQAGIISEDDYMRQRGALRTELKALLSHRSRQTSGWARGTDGQL